MSEETSEAYVRKTKDGNYYTEHDKASGYELFNPDINKAYIYVGWKPKAHDWEKLVPVKVVEIK